MAANGRKLLYLLAALLGLGVLSAFIAIASRDNLIRYTLNPGRSFGEGAQPTAPDYATNASWAILPKTATKPVDVFFIYSTIYFSGEYWNAPIGNPAVRERIARTVVPLYAAPFSASANLFLPLYRQAAPYSFMTSSEDGRAARELAYTDVARAFESFIATRNQGRPFIIAGYGQGALYGMRLISELKPADRGRLIAGYLLELALPVEVAKAMSTATPLCNSPDQTGCLVAWHSTTKNARGDLPRENALVWRPNGGFDATRGRELACVNPLTWTVSGRAGSSDMNLGSAELTGFSGDGIVLTRGVTSADCWNGLLFVDVAPDPIFLWAGPRYRELFPSSVNPFFADIKDNVARRIESFAAQASLPEPPEDTEIPDPAAN
ncbi:MAG: DUF3089 domain-containing protein [Alphaproteobacteria bacterium]|nr:DUF3089 domain-containing protein [Alphaproteobacteria bacterium]